jgi:HK97 gp10 family phage protein
VTRVKLQGFRELEAALEALPKSTGRNVLRRIARAALEPLAEHARGLAPVEEGALRASIAVSEKRTRRVKRSHRFDNKTGLEMAMGPGSGEGALPYASFVEFGTIDTPAQPFMRPAWDSGADGMLSYIADNLGAEIDKAADRLARKRARLG